MFREVHVVGCSGRCEVFFGSTWKLRLIFRVETLALSCKINTVYSVILLHFHCLVLQNMTQNHNLPAPILCSRHCEALVEVRLFICSTARAAWSRSHLLSSVGTSSAPDKRTLWGVILPAPTKAASRSRLQVLLVLVVALRPPCQPRQWFAPRGIVRHGTNHRLIVFFCVRTSNPPAAGQLPVADHSRGPNRNRLSLGIELIDNVKHGFYDSRLQVPGRVYTTQ
jgi:hypothetical protein